MRSEQQKFNLANDVGTTIGLLLILLFLLGLSALFDGDESWLLVADDAQCAPAAAAAQHQERIAMEHVVQAAYEDGRRQGLADAARLGLSGAAL